MPSKRRSCCATLCRYFLLFVTVFVVVYVFMISYFFSDDRTKVTNYVQSESHNESQAIEKDIMREKEKTIKGYTTSIPLFVSFISPNNTKRKHENTIAPFATETIRDERSKQKSTRLEEQIESNHWRDYSSIKNIPLAQKLRSEKIVAPIFLTLTSIENALFSSKNLVLGIAVNTNAKNFAIFCHSFRAVSPHDVAIIFINSPIPSQHRQIAESSGVHLFAFDSARLLPTFLINYHPSTLRWILFHRLLAAYDYRIARLMQKIIVVDVRDTFFQSDPFQMIPEESNIHVFGESPGLTIISCGWNSGWIQGCFGDELLSNIGSNPIICSGISLGTADKMFNYIALMSRVLLGVKDDTISLATSKFPQCERNGVDQGVHNVLVHSKLIPSVQVEYPYSFPVINMQSSPEFVPINETSTELRDGNNKLFSIVHQYDRLMTYQRALALKYVNWVNMADPEMEWKDDAFCQRFQKVQDAELFPGECDMGNIRLLSPASCCEVCSSSKNVKKKESNGEDVLKDCTGFTYVGGVCYLKSCSLSRIGNVIDSYRNRPQQYFSEGATCAYFKS